MSTTNAPEPVPVPTKGNDTVRMLIIALVSVATAWGTMKAELSSLVKGEGAALQQTLRADAAATITAEVLAAEQRLQHHLDSGMQALADTIEQRMAATVAAIPMPRTVDRAVLVPTVDSTATAAAGEARADLVQAVRNLAVIAGRMQEDQRQLRELMRKRGLKLPEPDKQPGYGH